VQLEQGGRFSLQPLFNHAALRGKDFPRTTHENIQNVSFNDELRLSQTEKQRRLALPYSALDARCPMCRAVPGRRCVSSRRKALRYPHRQRIEAAATEYRSEARREILEQTRRHPFARAFSPRRMADEDCFVVQIAKEEAGKANVEGRGSLTGPGLMQR
jgi:hypothetical protein